MSIGGGAMFSDRGTRVAGTIVTPIYFEGRFGWLHSPAGPVHAGAATGVILCSAFAQEEVCTHHGLMALASDLAAAGHPTIRFDYRGTGDSDDVDVTLDTLGDDVARAADCLRQQADVGAVVLVGVRLGAAVALRAVGGIDGVWGMALLAPMLSGQAFMRETRASASVASLSGLDPVPPIESGEPLNTNGFRWSGALQQEVAALDLTQAPAKHFPILAIPGRADRRTGKLAAAWRERGAAVTEADFPDYEGWMQDPTTNETPVATFVVVRDWIAALPPCPNATAPSRPVAVAHSVEIGACVEHPVRFGKDDALAGILCRPHGQSAAPVAALLLHEGSTHHIGNGRAYVTLARHLAEAGIASLRVDLTGMGDSPAGDNPRHPHYDPERIAEGVAGLDLLEREGFTKAMAFGLCSGAHTALQVTLADDRVVGNIVLNLQKFIWHYGDDIRIATRDNKRSFKAYVRAMRNPGEWRRAFAGEADFKGIARVLAKRSMARAGHAIRSLLPPAPDSEVAQVRALMRKLADRRVHTTLMFSDEDPGLGEMWMQFGAKARRLSQYAPAKLVMLDQADHHFNGTSARTRYFDLARDAILYAVAEHARDLPPVPTPGQDDVGMPVRLLAG